MLESSFTYAEQVRCALSALPYDCIRIIVKYIKYGGAFKSLMLTCTWVHDAIVGQTYNDAVDRHLLI